MQKEKIRLRDTLGLTPFPLRFKQALIAFRGEEDVPKSKFGLSSLKLLYPKISPTLWRGKHYLEKTVIISNLFNHTQTPVEEGWSVKKTQVLDFRGKRLTYNSHNGTDLAIPVGSTVCTAAPGEVVEIRSDLNRGGLKVFIDHGKGLMTCYAHLAKALVKVGDIVSRSQAIAISGYSGIDAVLTYPFGIPHVHFNVWLNGIPVDPFPHGENKSMWSNGHLPTFALSTDTEKYCPSVYNESKILEAIMSCKTLNVRERMASVVPLKYKAAHAIIEMNYYPTRFKEQINLYDKEYNREPRLDLPFKAEEFERVVFLDDILGKK
jgi:murein DD-endopeptidase MepM/ murein hydrolase activator NlpD